MAAVSVVFDGSRVIDAESTTNWVAASATPTLEPDFKYQGSNSISAQVKTTEVGFYYRQAGVAHNFSSPQRVWLAKVIATNKDVLDGNGLTLEIGTGTRTAYYRYFVFTAATYPIAGGFQVVPIDPSVTSHRSATVGSPNISAVEFFGVQADFSATSRAQNVAMDAIDYITNGTGLTLVGGDGADVDGTFDDFINTDEGISTNRWGVVQTRNGILYVNGTLTIGSAIATIFTDSNKVLVFPSGRFDTGFCGMKINLQNAASQVALTSCTFNGRGTQGTPDTRPDYSVSSTVGVGASFTACSFNTFRNITANSKTTFSGCSFLNGLSLVQNSANITDCTFSGQTTTAGTALITSNLPNQISGCSFNLAGGSGHAISITTPGTYSFSGNNFTGYGASGTTSAAIYNNSGGAVTLNIVGGGSTPSVRNGAGATTTVNSNVSVTLTGLKNPSEVRVYSAGTTTQIAGQEDVTTGTFTFGVAAGQTVDISILSLGYQNMRLLAYSTSSDTSVPISQVIDRQYANP
jgi:hypothetical protein